LVDDYDDARLTVREALENAGYNVIEAQNGQDALDVLVKGPLPGVSLIVLDLQMPVMDGWRLLELLRCYVGLSKIPVIILTAQEPRLEQSQHPSVFGYIRSPYRLEDVVAMVDDCMTGVRATSAARAAEIERSRKI